MYHRVRFLFFFNDTATTEIYTLSDTLSLHDALPISSRRRPRWPTRRRGLPGWRSEEHTSELQSPLNISYAVFCLKKKNIERRGESTARGSRDQPPEPPVA